MMRALSLVMTQLRVRSLAVCPSVRLSVSLDLIVLYASIEYTHPGTSRGSHFPLCATVSFWTFVFHTSVLFTPISLISV